jgi:putative DNA primase/helicase
MMSDPMTPREMKSRVNQSDMLVALSPSMTLAVEKIGKHVPCPVHGGKDGFRVKHANDGALLGICNSCHDGKWLDVYDLIAWINGGSLAETFRACQDYAGNDRLAVRPRLQVRPDKPDSKKYKNIVETWERGNPIADGSPQCLYLQRRLRQEFRWEFDALRSSALPYWDYSGDGVVCSGVFPVILAKVTDEQDNLINVHRIYLTTDGDKASVSSPKKMMPSYLAGNTLGCTVKLSSEAKGEKLYCCEGVETGIAIFNGLAKKSEVWCALTAGSLKRLTIPDWVNELMICADKDHSGTGEQAANVLAQSFLGAEQSTRKVKILTPTIPIPCGLKGVDWLDQLSMEAVDV